MLKLVYPDDDNWSWTPLRVVYGNNGNGTNSKVESCSSNGLNGTAEDREWRTAISCVRSIFGVMWCWLDVGIERKAGLGRWELSVKVLVIWGGHRPSAAAACPRLRRGTQVPSSITYKYMKTAAGETEGSAVSTETAVLTPFTCGLRAWMGMEGKDTKRGIVLAVTVTGRCFSDD